MFSPFSLDQLTVFVAVVDEGTFSGAGRRLGRVQSAISHAIAQLEQTLGSPLFDRSGRRPVLTESGRRLVAEARLVLGQVQALTETATRLRGEPETKLSVAIDVFFPTAELMTLCVQFAEQHPASGLRIDIGILGDTVDEVRAGRAALGVCNLGGLSDPELVTWHLGDVRLVPVCAASHPLAQVAPRQGEAELHRHIQVVHSERSGADQDWGVLAARTWRVRDRELKHRLIASGVGWGSLPRWLVADELAAGSLVQLRPEPWPDGHLLPLHVVARRALALGPAAQWVRDALTQRSDPEL